MIHTVLGPIEADTLGPTLCHEHVAIRTPGVWEAWPELVVGMKEIERRSLDALTAAYDVGVRTILDHTTFDLGRDPLLLREVSMKSGMAIVATTGVWCSRPRFFGHKTSAELAQLFIRDAQLGFAGSGVKPGMIKACATSAQPDAYESTVLIAAAMAHAVTQLPITLHTDALCHSGLAAVDLLLGHGVDPGRICVGHSGDTEDLDYLRALVERGVLLGLDRFGSGFGPTDARRTQVVVELCDLGAEDQLMLGHDANAWNDRDSDAWRARHRPDWHFAFIPQVVSPALAGYGVPADVRHKLFVANPRRWLAGTGATGDSSRPDEALPSNESADRT